MTKIIAAIWVYFGACGFETPIINDDSPEVGAVMLPAPNIKGYWVRKEAVVGVVDWRTSRGLECSTIYAKGTPHSVHVIGTTKEVLDKLRE